MLFDNQFNFVSASSGYQQVGANGILTPMIFTNLPITSSGYLYIYTSNATANVPVFFDNLQVTHARGPLLEEDHYYPFGLTMAGISDKVLKAGYAENRYRFNKGSELQNKEFSDGTGLEMYETHLRELDPQLGRWWQVDPKTDQSYESTSPYASMNNSPSRYNDPNGNAGQDAKACCDVVGVWNIFRGTQKAAAAAEAIGGGPEDPVADAAAAVIEVGGNLWALGKLVFGSSQAVTTAAAAANSAKASTPPASSQTKAEDKKSAAEQKADKLSQKQRPGQDFTKAGKEAVKDLNKEKNNGQTTCEKRGVNTQDGKQHVKGETPPDNETNVDHIDAKSKGGSGTPDNGQVLCRSCNIDKSNH